MADSDSHPSVDTDAIKSLARDVRYVREKLDTILEKMAEGQTKMALQDQRLDNHGSLIAAQQIALNVLRDEVRVVRDEGRDRSCDDCETRIERLEIAEVKRSDRDEQSKSYPWWLPIVASAILSCAVPWIITGMAVHAKAAP